VPIMAGRRPTALAVQAQVRNKEQLASAGVAVRRARLRRHPTQARLGARAGVGRMSISRAERGLGGGLTLDAWQRIAIALDITLTVHLQRDQKLEPQDAGHLSIQELVLRLGRRHGYGRQVELRSKPDEAWRSIDVALADDRRRRLLVVECWNVIGDVGTSARSSTRKAQEAEAIADLRWGGEPHAVSLVWVVRATRLNRELVSRYPEVFAARFPGRGAAWAAALNDGTEPPSEPGLVWASVNGTRIWPWRRR
jgi:transcriptional regulator with XRE-family HTH domain